MIVIVYSSSERSVRGTSTAAIQISGRAGGALARYRSARPELAPAASASPRVCAPSESSTTRPAAPRQQPARSLQRPGDIGLIGTRHLSRRLLSARLLGDCIRAKGDQAGWPVVLRCQRIGARAQRGLARVAQAIRLVDQQHQRPLRRRRTANHWVGQRQHDQRGSAQAKGQRGSANAPAPQPPRQRQRRQQNHEEQKLWVAKNHRYEFRCE